MARFHVQMESLLLASLFKQLSFLNLSPPHGFTLLHALTQESHSFKTSANQEDAGPDVSCFLMTFANKEAKNRM